MKNYAIINSIFVIIGLGCFPAAAEDMQKIVGVNESCVYYKKQIENNTLVLFIVKDNSVMQTLTYTYDEEDHPKHNDLYIADINFDGFSDILFCIGQYTGDAFRQPVIVKKHVFSDWICCFYD